MLKYHGSRPAKARHSAGKAVAGEEASVRFGTLSPLSDGERSPVKGASLGKEAVLQASGRAGDIAAGLGGEKIDFSASCYVNQVHCENMAACPTLCPFPSTTFQMMAFSTRKRRPVEVILTPR
jgi:hypothetical protein